MKLVAIAFAVLLLAGLAVVLLAQLRDRRAMDKRRARLMDRPADDVETWFRTHYASLGIDRQLVIATLSKLATTLKCDMTRILPTDSFDDELGLKNLWPIQIDADDELTYFSEVELEELLGGSASADQLESVRESTTIEELLRRIDGVRRQAASSAQTV